VADEPIAITAAHTPFLLIDTRLYSDGNQGCCLGVSRATTWFFEQVPDLRWLFEHWTG
jgi:hypothetical protein